MAQERRLSVLFYQAPEKTPLVELAQAPCKSCVQLFSSGRKLRSQKQGRIIALGPGSPEGETTLPI